MKLDEQPRPKLQLPITKSEIGLEVLAAIPCLLTFAVILAFWSALPNVVASHFDLQGQANGWSNKGMLWILAFTSLGTYLAIGITCRYPHTYNYVWPITEQNAQSQYMLARKFMRLLKLELLMVMFAAVWSVIQFNTGQTKAIDSIQLLMLVSVVLITCIGYITVSFLRR